MVKPIILLSLVIALTVVLNSTHVRDVLLAVPFHAADTGASKALDDHLSAKLGNELHNHVDKAGKVLGSDNPQADSRSLRLLRDIKRPTRNNLFDLFESWRNYLAMYLN
jgi:hypothetical protein